MDSRFTPPSDLLEKVVENRTVDYVTVEEIKLALHERSFALPALALASLALVTPPGLTVIPGLPICLIAAQMACGKETLWLPKWLSKLRIKRALLARLIEKAAPRMRKAEKWIRPRWTFLFSGKAVDRAAGVMMLALGASIMLPFPFTHLLPGIGVIFMALGLIGRDGAQLLLGTIVGAAGLAVTCTVLFFGVEALEKMYHAATAK
ncbi:MAG: exopolysaccharide biosynthesis protein [Rickettsiales bacterium]